MTWNVRITKDSDGMFCAKECYYNDKGELSLHTEDPIELYCESKEELIKYVAMILRDLKKSKDDVIDEKTIKLADI